MTSKDDEMDSAFLRAELRHWTRSLALIVRDIKDEIVRMEERSEGE